MDELPVQAGTYALILELTHNQILDIGQLGKFDFHAGWYVYVGSAHGPGGIRARLGRHLRGAGKTRWHIDYLRIVSTVRGYGYIAVEALPLPNISQECTWVQKLAAETSATLPIPKFGASDCKMGCAAHLIYFSQLRCTQIFEILSNIQFEIVCQKLC